jgi:hypothetical protein
MSDVSPLASIGPDSVIVRVGAEGPNLKGRGTVPLWPIVHVIFSRESQEGQSRRRGKWLYPAKLKLRWQDNEKPYKEGDKKRYLALYEPAAEKTPPWVVYRVPQEDRELFERLQRKWKSWYLRIEVQGLGHKDFMVGSTTGNVEPTDLLLTCFPNGAEYDRERFIDVLATRAEINRRRDLEKAVTEEDAEKAKRFLAVDKKEIRRALTEQADILELLGGPLPWVVDPDPKPEGYYKLGKDDHKAIIENYLQVIAAGRNALDTAKKAGEGPGVLKQGELVTAAIRRAHIFELTYESYSEIYRAADVYTTETVAGMKYHLGDGAEAWIPEEEKQEHQRLVEEAGKTSPFPEHLPFECCWFAIGRGRLSLTHHQAEIRGLRPDLYQYRVIALVLTESGMVLEVCDRFDPVTGTLKYDFITHRNPAGQLQLPEEEWFSPYSLMPWIVLYMVEAINDHHTTLVNGVIGMSERMLYERGAKKFGIPKPIPAPFYTVLMKDQSIKLASRRVNRHNRYTWSYSHRFDRRGCEAMNVERGTLPLSTEIRQALAKRTGYVIFDSAAPIDDEVLLEKLRKRRILAKSPNEWMAVKTWWRDGSVVGDESLPYIPSTRKGTKGVLGYKDTAASKLEHEAPKSVEE